ncbi:MAG TPA: NAD(P)H-binding protein [Baekduia sp.]|uniref:NAD(P)H-binding protein n=1 Tax=Baekduia sp. TaxID=2600305 RepID=UPI002D7845E8|nr:NAD(P)H-binding protein [Baekduia sp.]HET6505231.1 NAD(P)H-binding protein [Baekduia sp.]
MSLIITGASGHLGRRTAELLLDTEGVDAADVVLITRDPSKLDDLAARGARVRRGDFSEPSSLGAAFAGATRVLIVSTDVVGARMAGHQAAIDAATAAGARLIAYTSLPNPVAENPAGAAADHRATEEALVASGVAHTFLRNALYNEFRIPEAQAAAASGTFHHNMGDGVTAYVSREDCAAAAAAVLAGGDEHAGKAYDITGPELLSGADLAKLYGARESRVDDDAFAAGLVAAGLPEAVAPLLVSFGRAIREGYLDQVSGDVEALTGRAPRSVAEVLAAAGVGAGAA